MRRLVLRGGEEERELVLLFFVEYGFFLFSFFWFLWDGRIKLTNLKDTSKRSIFLIDSEDCRGRNSCKDVEKDSSGFSHASLFSGEYHGQHPFLYANIFLLLSKSRLTYSLNHLGLECSKLSFRCETGLEATT